MSEHIVGKTSDIDEGTGKTTYNFGNCGNGIKNERCHAKVFLQ